MGGGDGLGKKMFVDAFAKTLQGEGAVLHLVGNAVRVFRRNRETSRT